MSSQLHSCLLTHSRSAHLPPLPRPHRPLLGGGGWSVKRAAAVPADKLGRVSLRSARNVFKSFVSGTNLDKQQHPCQSGRVLKPRPLGSECVCVCGQSAINAAQLEYFIKAHVVSLTFPSSLIELKEFPEPNMRLPAKHTTPGPHLTATLALAGVLFSIVPLEWRSRQDFARPAGGREDELWAQSSPPSPPVSSGL